LTGDYLWDRSGEADATVADLERLMAPFAWQPRPWSPPLRAAGRSWPLPFVAALAATITIVAGLSAFVTLLNREPQQGVAVTRLEGTPTVARAPVREGQRLTAGRWLETNSTARALVEIENVGRIEVQPSSRLALIRSRAGDHRLHLARGTVQAVIVSPPGHFSMGTPSATAVDLGCVYTMTVGDDDIGLVQVLAGWVGFEWRGRESFIPAGASCVTRPRLGPGTPYYEDTSPAFRAALMTLDLGGSPPADRAAAIDRVIAESRPRDVLTLWHLLSRVQGADRDRVFDRLSGFVPPPPGVTRDAVRNGNTDALDAWWNALDLGTTAWWRTWTQQWRGK
jgi:hypothetical protein